MQVSSNWFKFQVQGGQGRKSKSGIRDRRSSGRCLTEQQQLLLQEQQLQGSLGILGVLGFGQESGIGWDGNDRLIVDGRQGEGDGQHQGEDADELLERG